jgi:hypothetical protein
MHGRSMNKPGNAERPQEVSGICCGAARPLIDTDAVPFSRRIETPTSASRYYSGRNGGAMPSPLV